MACLPEGMNGQDCMEAMHCQQHALVGLGQTHTEVVLADTGWASLRPLSAMYRQAWSIANPWSHVLLCRSQVLPPSHLNYADDGQCPTAYA